MMPPGRQGYILCGFSQELDWRPLHFVDPVPPARICNACGLLPNVICSLPCGHVLCRSCYQQCQHVCPLDGDACPEYDVLLRDFPAESIARKKVKCWNEVHGCSVITAASDISRHFRNDCKRHFVSCPKCSAPVPRGDVCVHLTHCHVPPLCSESTANVGESPESSLQSVNAALCNSLEQNNSSITSMWSELRMIKKAAIDAWNEIVILKAVFEERTDEVRSGLKRLSSSQNSHLQEFAQNIVAAKDCHDTKFNQIKEQMDHGLKVAAELKKENESCLVGLTAFEARLQNQVGMMKVSLAQVSAQNNWQNERLDELSHSMHALREVLEGKLEKVGRNQDSSARSATNTSARQDAVPAESGEAPGGVSSVLQPIVKASRAQQWVLTGLHGLKCLEKKAAREGQACFLSYQGYLYGYSISAGVFFKMCRDSKRVCMYFSFQLHDEGLDKSVQWPFEQVMNYCIINPDTTEMHKLYSYQSTMAVRIKWPTGTSHNVIRYFDHKALDLRELECDGSIKNDRLLLRLELAS